MAADTAARAGDDQGVLKSTARNLITGSAGDIDPPKRCQHLQQTLPDVPFGDMAGVKLRPSTGRESMGQLSQWFDIQEEILGVHRLSQAIDDAMADAANCGKRMLAQILFSRVQIESGGDIANTDQAWCAMAKEAETAQFMCGAKPPGDLQEHVGHVHGNNLVGEHFPHGQDGIVAACADDVDIDFGHGNLRQ
jgi:hypothetical protein